MANAPRPPKLKDVLLNDIRPMVYKGPGSVVKRPPKLKDVIIKDIGNIQRPQPRPFRTNSPR